VAERLLAARELDVLRGIADGLSNAEIGQRLYLAETTVKDHVANAMSKLHARNRAHAVARGYQEGLLPADRRVSS